MILQDYNPCLGDTCIPLAKIKSVMEIINPTSLDVEPDKDLTLPHDVIVGAWHTLRESVLEIEQIINYCEDQEYAEAHARSKAHDELEEKIYQIRSSSIQS